MHKTTNRPRVAIIGGGASGFFSAIRLGELFQEAGMSADIRVFEATANFLKKVSISGGGRCNVIHHQFDSTRLVDNYPRGKKELRSAFSRFQAIDMLRWLNDKGVELVTEPDGRMFPKTNTSSTIVQCFIEEADKRGIKTFKSKKVLKLESKKSELQLVFKDDDTWQADFLILATGSAPAGYRLAESLGLELTERAPSLFSFKINSPLLKELSGTSFSSVALECKVEGKLFKQEGPMLITHWGLSGPAILKLSAWGAREMKWADYKFDLKIRWFPGKSLDELKKLFEELLSEKPKAQIGNLVLDNFTKKFWSRFLNYLDVSPDIVANELSKKDINKITEHLYISTLRVNGKNRFKDEFVECGGVGLKQMDFKTMSFKKDSRIHVTGELLDIDGITGGFNFQNAWTSAWHAAEHIFNEVKNKQK